MKQFTEYEVMNAYVMEDAIEDIKHMLHALNNKQVRYKKQIIVPIGKGDIMMYFPANDLVNQYAAVKSMVISGGKSTSNTLLTDLNTAEPVGLIASTYLTQLRTGAMSGIATDLLARKNAKVLGMIGTGIMALQQVLGVLAVRNIEKIILFNRTIEKAETFKVELKDAGVDTEIEVVQNVDDLTEEADIINTATPSQHPVFNDDKIKRGVHINGIGSFMPKTKELNMDTIAKSKYTIFDDKSGVESSAGEFITAQENGQFNFNDGIELKDALTMHFDRNDNDITIFKSIGAPYYDMAVAIGAYKALTK